MGVAYHKDANNSQMVWCKLPKLPLGMWQKNLVALSNKDDFK